MYNQITEFIRQRVSVPDEVLEKAFLHGSVVQYKKGDVLLRTGEYCRFIGFINSGLIMVTLHDEAGKEIVCNFFFENEFFTYVESLNEHIPSQKNFVALEDCEVLIMSKSELPAIFSIHPAFESLFNRIILEGLQRMIQYAQEKRTQTAEERYLHVMKMHPELFGRVPLKIIANYMGVAAPSLSRLRKRLGTKKRQGSAADNREINRG